MKSGLTFIAALALSATVFANGNQTKTTEKWNGSINKAQLGKYLKLSSDQSEEVADICDFFEAEMKMANRAKEGQDEKVRKAVYGNLKLPQHLFCCGDFFCCPYGKNIFTLYSCKI